MSLHYLIDGYNTLYALPEMPAGDWEAKRDALLQRIAKESPHGNNRLTVVFDSREGSGSRTRSGAVETVFTAGETADDWISHHVRAAANPRVLTVVTDDQGLRRLIRGTGAKWLSNADFWLQAKRPQAREVPPETNRDSITEELKKKWL